MSKKLQSLISDICRTVSLIIAVTLLVIVGNNWFIPAWVYAVLWSIELASVVTCLVTEFIETKESK